MKKYLAALLGACVLLHGAAEAAYEQRELKTEQVKCTYTVFTLPENGTLEVKANDIMLEAMDKQISLVEKEPEKYKSVSLGNKVLRDDKDLLCFKLTTGHYVKGAAHGIYAVEGYTFDKKTGKRLEALDYFPDLNAKLVYDGIYGGFFKIYGFDRTTRLSVNKLLDTRREDFKVNWENILVEEDGRVLLVFQVYHLAPYAVGNTYVELNGEIIKKLSGK